MTLRSPENNLLRRLEGNPGDVRRYGQDLVDAGAVMRRTATQLKRISEGTRQIAESVDAVREVAGETYPDLEKAATRYERTGEVLKTYAVELDTAQTGIHPLIPQIEDAHRDLATARTDEADADRLVRDHRYQMPWEDDVSDSQKQAALDAQTSAETARENAESRLASLWGTFDRKFSTWSDAYDDAVDGIEDAFDAADNNDAWGEDLLPVLGWIAVGLAVVAIFVTGPIALAIAAIGAVIALVMVAINVLKYAKGRGNWLDLTLSIVGVIPFARPLITGARGGIAALRGVSATFSAGRGIMRASVRSTFPRFGYAPMSGGPFSRLAGLGNNAWAGTRNAYYAVRSGMRSSALLSRFSMRDFFIDRPVMNLWRGGHNSVTTFSNFLLRNGSRVGDDAVAWANSAEVASFAPSQFAQAASVFESSVTWIVNSDFMATQNSERYSGWRASLVS
ncbi:hypothetical protein ACFC1W_03785 [Microbacterium sp. NPDC056003]|uniref:hypothetical protein n=1 Tax=Microbacterium sp. NPDC056003 TaxID=3345676 RepID=UPI0035DA7749